MLSSWQLRQKRATALMCCGRFRWKAKSSPLASSPSKNQCREVAILSVHSPVKDIILCYAPQLLQLIKPHKESTPQMSLCQYFKLSLIEQISQRPGVQHIKLGVPTYLHLLQLM